MKKDKTFGRVECGELGVELQSLSLALGETAPFTQGSQYTKSEKVFDFERRNCGEMSCSDTSGQRVNKASFDDKGKAI